MNNGGDVLRITRRDMEVLEALNKLRVLDIDTITTLCGFSQHCKCANRMAILYKNGYVKYEQKAMTTKKYYFLSQKGMNTLFPAEVRKGKKGEYRFYREPPRYRESNLNHEIITANVLCYLLKWNPALTINDFQSDREMQQMKPQQRKKLRHCCDLFCEKYRIKVEVELTKKDMKRLQNNIAYNGNKYVQVWVVGNNEIYNRLVAVKKKYVYFDIHIIKLEELENNPIIFEDLYENLMKKNRVIKSKKEDVAEGQINLFEKL